MRSSVLLGALCQGESLGIGLLSCTGDKNGLAEHSDATTHHLPAHEHKCRVVVVPVSDLDSQQGNQTGFYMFDHCVHNVLKKRFGLANGWIGTLRLD